ncbi:hypothetical protein SteCoe_8820 [Stentor coeruleus]|uniref:MalT-like TPR region domain-containing protein n=1 Tax=Stentor coeruleus TaxID=5963 RepID=A0A1R2CJB2_9CILI|nr:hypothetical protein SteCoe_8820 [Stentor coeruleus]
MAEAEILRINKQAMKKLRDKDPNQALTLLNSAQEILPQVNIESLVWGITFNNLGCYFKKTQDFEMARKHFSKALEIMSKKPSDPLTIAGTCLNMSSVNCELNSHEKALQFALKAYNLLLSPLEKDINSWTSLIIAHHCAGHEYECLNKKQEAVNMYRQGWELSKEKLGNSHKLTITMKRTLEKCQALKSSAIFSSKSKKQSFKSRSHSSNPNSRVRLPDMAQRTATPTKEVFGNLQKVERIPLKTVAVPIRQMNAINSLVKEIEKTLEHRPRKYIFIKSQDNDLEGLEKSQEFKEPFLYPDTLPVIKKNTLNFSQETSNNMHLQTIPEANNEDLFEISYQSPPIIKRNTRRLRADLNP